LIELSKKKKRKPYNTICPTCGEQRSYCKCEEAVKEYAKRGISEEEARVDIHNTFVRTRRKR